MKQRQSNEIDGQVPRGSLSTNQAVVLGALVGAVVFAAVIVVASEGRSLPTTLLEEPAVWPSIMFVPILGALLGLTVRLISTRVEAESTTNLALTRAHDAEATKEWMSMGAGIVGVGFLLTDEEDKVVDADFNAQRIIGLRSEYLCGRPLSSLLRSRDKDTAQLTRSDGGHALLRIARKSIVADDGTSLQVVGLVDISDLSERTESLEREVQELRLVSNLRKRFVGYLCREIRSPLTAVTVFAELARELAVEKGLEDLNEDVTQIGLAALQVTRLVDGVGDLLKIETGSLSVVQEPLGLVEFLDQNSFKADLRCSNPPFVLADAERLKQILGEVLACLKPLIEGEVAPAITVSQPEARVVRICVSGPVDASRQGQLERTFAMVASDAGTATFDSALLDAGQATGVGLFISRQLARLQGGLLHLQFENGHALFNLDLGEAMVGGQTDTEPSMLVIERGKLLADAMTALGVGDVEGTSNPDEAIRLAARRRPKAVVFGATSSSSTATLNALTQHRNHPILARIPFIFADVDEEHGVAYVMPFADILLPPPGADVLEGLRELVKEGLGRLFLFTHDPILERSIFHSRRLTGIDVRILRSRQDLQEVTEGGTAAVFLIDLLYEGRAELIEVLKLVEDRLRPPGCLFGLIPQNMTEEQSMELMHRLETLRAVRGRSGAELQGALKKRLDQAQAWVKHRPEPKGPPTQ